MTRLRTAALATMRVARDRAIALDPVVAVSALGPAGRWRERSRATSVMVLLHAALLLASVGVFTVAGPPTSAWAQARSERLGDVRFEGELRADGSLRVVERREFVYDGAYRGAYREWSLRDLDGIDLHAISDAEGTTYQLGTCSEDQINPGEYELEEDGGTLRVTWCWDPPPTDTSRTIVLDYTMQGAGSRHADASLLDWKMIGETTSVPTASVTAELGLPSDDVRFWGHGPLTGTIEKSGPSTLRLEAENVPPNTFVELRALMPADALSETPSDGRRVRRDILEEEECLAIAANAERARARGEEPTQDCDPAAGRKRLATGALAVGLLAGGVGWFEIFRRHGREHPVPDSLPDYERDLPSDHPPAFVDYLLNWGNLSDKALVATILDLARRKHLRLKREVVHEKRLLRDRERTVTVFERGAPPERRWERQVGVLLFDDAGGGADVVSDEDLKDWVGSHRDVAYEWWQSWTSAVARDTAGAHWIEPKAWVAGSIIVGLALIAGAIGAAVAGANLILVGVTVAAGIGAAAASPLMRRRTEEGRVLEHRWRRFGAYLTDYSLMPERGPEYLTLWGRWLVYAVPLGVADTVMRNLNAKLSEAELQQVAGDWYPMYVGGHMFGFSEGLSTITQAIPTSQIASSPASSSSGTGGGFSGGGGGGVGGGGSGSF